MNPTTTPKRPVTKDYHRQTKRLDWALLAICLMIGYLVIQVIRAMFTYNPTLP